MNRYFPNAQHLEVGNHDLLAQKLAACDADWVFVIGPDLLPYSTLPGVRPDSVRVAHRQPMRFLSRNSVTGEFNADHGPELWPLEVLLAEASGTSAASNVSLVPLAMSQWYVNVSGVAAYRCAHASFTGRLATASNTQARRELEISASLGADAPHGYAWIAGACAALLGFSEETAAWMEDLEASRLAALDYARLVRLETTFRVRVLTPGECRIIRDLCFQMPPADIYAQSASLAEDGTEAGERNARILRAAGDWLWLGQYPPD